jgi:hypothetical protein
MKLNQDEYLEQMLEGTKRLEEIREKELFYVIETAALSLKHLNIQVERNNILNELLDEIKRLRLTGIQP